MMLKRFCRYQAAIVRDEDDHILLIQHREHASGRAYWVVPGGGIEDGESEEACVCREAMEETNLEVEVVRLLLDEPVIDGRVYERSKTYLCRVVSGEASPGHEPEPEIAANYGIHAVGWYDLMVPESWGEVYEDRYTGPMLMRIRSALGYG
ncbi:MAG: NUDIX hydrolase [Tepidiformaceae bacterium]